MITTSTLPNLIVIVSLNCLFALIDEVKSISLTRNWSKRKQRQYWSCRTWLRVGTGWSWWNALLGKIISAGCGCHVIICKRWELKNETRNLVQKSHVIDCDRMRLTDNRTWICWKRRALTILPPLFGSITCYLIFWTKFWTKPEYAGPQYTHHS